VLLRSCSNLALRPPSPSSTKRKEGKEASKMVEFCLCLKIAHI